MYSIPMCRPPSNILPPITVTHADDLNKPDVHCTITVASKNKLNRSTSYFFYENSDIMFLALCAVK